MGKGGPALQERVQKQKKEAEERAATAVFESCPHVKELWLGTWYKKGVTMEDCGHGDGSGKKELKWSSGTGLDGWESQF